MQPVFPRPYCRVGFFRKYDDVVRQQPKGWFRGTRQFDASEFTANRKWALETMLPRWPGFCGTERASPTHFMLTAAEALQELDHVVKSITFVSVWEDNQPESKRGSFRPDGFTDFIIAEVWPAVAFCN